MEIQVFPDLAAASIAAEKELANVARDAIGARGRFWLAVSGGSNPWDMFSRFAAESLAWDKVQIFQVDERVAPEGDKDRNLSHLRQSLAAAPLRPDQVHAMPVERANLEEAAAEYARTIVEICGAKPTFDLVHLGLGPDGHTASLVPGDEVLAVSDRDVATSGPYQGRRRLTLTYPIINRARRILWLITGAGKADALWRLQQRDLSIPGGRVVQGNAIAFVDQPAAAKLQSLA